MIDVNLKPGGFVLKNIEKNNSDVYLLKIFEK